MKTGRSRVARRPRVARNPRLWRKIAAIAAVAAIVPAAAVAAWLLLSGGSAAEEEPPGPPRAVIVDQLSLTAPNPSFAGDATSMLAAAGYEVDYVPGEAVTVEYYRELPAQGYDLVLLRAHAAGVDFNSQDYQGDIALFTSEPAGDGYEEEKREKLLKGVGFSPEQMQAGELYYGIPPAFIESRMHGDFDGATVVLMGCDVLRAKRMADAFMQRGAGAVVGWDKQVTADHTDAATLSVLRHMLEEHLPVQEATAAAMDDVGPDPSYGAELLAHVAAD